MKDISEAASQKRAEVQAKRDEQQAAANQVKQLRERGEELITALSAVKLQEMADDTLADEPDVAHENADAGTAGSGAEHTREGEMVEESEQGRKRTRSVADRGPSDANSALDANAAPSSLPSSVSPVPDTSQRVTKVSCVDSAPLRYSYVAGLQKQKQKAKETAGTNAPSAKNNKDAGTNKSKAR